MKFIFFITLGLLMPATPMVVTAQEAPSTCEDPEAVYKHASEVLKSTTDSGSKLFALGLMKVAADAGHPKAQSIVGYHLADDKKFEESIGYLSKSAMQGDIFAAKNLRSLHNQFLDGLPDLKARTLKALEEASLAGSAPAAAELGGLYYHGGGGLQADPAKALSHLERAATGGDANSANTLAVMYSESIGVDGDKVKAVEYFRQAAEAGHAKAQASLGLAYAGADGVERDPIEAFKWMRLSARQKEVTGANALADFIRGLTPVQIEEGLRRVSEFLNARGEKVSPEQLMQELAAQPEAQTPSS